MDDARLNQLGISQFASGTGNAASEERLQAEQQMLVQGSGSVVINADDWGRDSNTTDRILDCVQRRVVSSVSAMVFMEDSERAADVAREQGVDAGLHLNLTTRFSSPQCMPALMEQQQQCTRFLRSHRLAPVFYHPRLAASFQSVVRAQMDEFERIYGHAPNRVDGHHHMHLCANVLLAKMLPPGIAVRRNFSFLHGEKSILNRAYRNRQDRALARRYSVTDLFFALRPLDPLSRLEEIFSLASGHTIEIETHPVDQDEFNFLTQGGLMGCMGGVSVAQGYVPRAGSTRSNAEAKV